MKATLPLTSSSGAVDAPGACWAAAIRVPAAPTPAVSAAAAMN